MSETLDRRTLAEMADMLVRRPAKRRRKRAKVHRCGANSPTTKARWKAGGKRCEAKVYTAEERAAFAMSLGLNSTA